MNAVVSTTVAATVLLFGTTKVSTEVTCPVDDTTFTATQITTSNTFGGFDRDLCPHAVGGSPLLFSVATCPSCGYSAPVSEYGHAVRKAVSDNVKKTWKAANPETIAASERWARHAQILRWTKVDPLDEAEAWILAGWSVRLTYDAALPDETLAGQQRALLEQATEAIGNSVRRGYARDIAVAEWLEGKTRKLEKDKQGVAAFTTAAVYRSRGESAHAERILHKYLRETEQKVLADAVGKMRESMKAERTHLIEALSRLRYGLALKNAPEGKKARASYMAAEFARRMDRKKEAVKFYNAARAAGGAEDPNLAELIEQGLKEVK